MTETMNPLHSTHPGAERLVELAKWLTTEERKRRLGQPSHWDQGRWVSRWSNPDDEEEIELIDTLLGGEEQPLRWSCHTPACAAGHIALEDGGLPAVAGLGGDPRPWRPGDRADLVSESTMVFDGVVEQISDHAQRALDLTENQADWLFSGGNEWIDMMRIIANVLGVSEAQLIVAVGGADMPDEPGVEDW